MANKLGAKVGKGAFETIHDLHKLGRGIPRITSQTGIAKRTVKIVLQYGTYPEYLKNQKFPAPALDPEIEKRVAVLSGKVASLEAKMRDIIAHLFPKGKDGANG